MSLFVLLNASDEKAEMVVEAKTRKEAATFYVKKTEVPVPRGVELASLVTSILDGDSNFGVYELPRKITR